MGSSVLTRPRAGFTLVEVMMALVILAVVLLGLAATTSGFVRTVATSDLQTAAITLAEDRIATIQMDPDCARIDSVYAGTESNFATLRGFTRRTDVVRVGGPGQPVNHTRITVTVAGPGLSPPVQRTVTMAAP